MPAPRSDAASEFTAAVPTADLCDAHDAAIEAGALRVVPPLLRDFGGLARFAGPVTTLRVHEDNALVRASLETPGDGRVLVVDGGGSLRTALLGGNLGALAQDNGWAGVIVHGCVRDTVEIAACRVGVRALGACPRKPRKAGEGARDVPVAVCGVPVQPGDWCYADEDGVLFSDRPLHGA